MEESSKGLYDAEVCCSAGVSPALSSMLTFDKLPARRRRYEKPAFRDAKDCSQ